MALNNIIILFQLWVTLGFCFNFELHCDFVLILSYTVILFQLWITQNKTWFYFNFALNYYFVSTLNYTLVLFQLWIKLWFYFNFELQFCFRAFASRTANRFPRRCPTTTRAWTPSSRPDIRIFLTTSKKKNRQSVSQLLTNMLHIWL